MSKLPRYLLLSFLFLAASFLSAEVWMQAARHTSFCTTSACDVVGEYIRFGEGNLIKLGAVFFWTLWGLVFFAGRYGKPWLWGPVAFILCGALAFDGALLGFQFIGLREKCALCVVVAAILFIGLLLFSWVRRSWLMVCVGIAVWCGGFTANAVLDLNVIPPAILDTPFLSHGEANGTVPQHVFFFSLHCDHCSKVLANLSINAQTLPGKWHLTCTDNKEDDFHRLATVLSSNATAENPFLEVLRLESLESVPPVPVSEELRQTARTARAYFKMKGFQGIPVLVVLERPGWEMILRGEGNIMDYLRIRGFLKRELNFPSPAPKPAGNATLGQ